MAQTQSWRDEFFLPLNASDMTAVSPEDGMIQELLGSDQLTSHRYSIETLHLPLWKLSRSATKTIQGTY